MKILLDTHILLWTVSNDERLSEKSRKIIENENNEIYTQKVNDPIILSKLIEEYSLDYEEDYKSVA